jgi:beta-glucanase (GH16 family)
VLNKRFLISLALAVSAGCGGKAQQATDNVPLDANGGGSPTGGGGVPVGSGGMPAGSGGGPGVVNDSGSNGDGFVSITGDDDHSPLPAPCIEVWRDDFEGPADSTPNPNNWTFEVTARPPNMELEYYTNRRENSYLDGEGHLVIQALVENYMGSRQPYTSARLNTATHFTQAYGCFAARIRIPAGQGLWPAFWMLGANIAQVGWPACGEIDILEVKGSQPAVTIGSLHATAYDTSGPYTLAGSTFADAFHVHTVEWSPTSVRWLVDGAVYQIVARSPAGWAFDHPFYVLLNLAVGGTWDGTPGPATRFPAQMFVDWVAVGRLPGVGDAGSD